MQRYMALAFDNIGRDPIGFRAASAYRAVRLFIIRGSDDVATAQQFRGERLAYTAGTAAVARLSAAFRVGVCRRLAAAVAVAVVAGADRLRAADDLLRADEHALHRDGAAVDVRVRGGGGCGDVAGRKLAGSRHRGQPSLDRAGRDHAGP